MSDAPLSNRFYKVGGALPQDVPSYVTRGSDDDLYDALKAGEFCYVLNSRQMGKSSLMVRTLTRLRAAGWTGVILDFSAKDSQSDQPDRWYAGIINQLNRELKLLDRQTFRQWLKERDFIAPVERLGEFIETVLLPGIDRSIVILIDEIDSTITLPFTDDFFALIRACYNKRAENPDYQRLTLALFGVAMPSELIGDVKRTPFNIGKAINLKGFDVEEALPLAAGLAVKADRPPVVLQEILHWTGGQPFLTQRVCQLVVDSKFPITEGSEPTAVEGLVRSQVIEQWESQDHQEHLKTIRKRLLDNEQKAGYLLELYRQIRQVGSLSAQNRLEERELQLAGLVVKRDGLLQVYNPIYAAVFDEVWIDAELKKLRPYSESFRAWISSGKTDRSRLLRGEALAEAEQWAVERSPSIEDQEFLSASRIQQQEEEAELAREKAAREAAEAAEQIQAQANRQAQRKIRRGSLVLSGTLVTALVFGGLAIFSVHKANQRREDAETLAEKAKNEATAAEKELTEIQQKKDDAEQALTQARDELTAAEEEVAQSQAELQDAETQRQAAEEQLKQAQQATQGQQTLLAQLEQNLANAKVDVDQAKQAKQDAQKLADQAQVELAQAEGNLDAINVHIDTVNELSSLVGELYGDNKPEAAEDTSAPIGLSFTDFTSDSPDLQQALLNSSIALAHLYLDPQDEENQARTAINKSIQTVKANSDVFKSLNGRSVAFFTYAVQGNLLEEGGIEAGSRDAFEQAFSYTDENPDFNQTSVAEAIARLLSATRSEDQNREVGIFRPLASAALKKHHDFQAKQLIRELDQALEEHRWRDADGLTWDALLSSAYSRDLSFLYSNIACDHLRKVDTLWSDHSEGRYGFSVQKNRFLATGNTPGQYNEAAWIKFIEEIGWTRIVADEIYFLLNYDELTWSEGVSGDDLSAPEAHLPAVYFVAELGGDLVWWVGGLGWWFSRIANCNL